jgi:hypothetical protein
MLQANNNGKTTTVVNAPTTKVATDSSGATLVQNPWAGVLTQPGVGTVVRVPIVGLDVVAPAGGGGGSGGSGGGGGNGR